MAAILPGDDRDDARQRARPGNIDAQDATVAHGAAEDAPDECVGVIEIRGIARAPGHLLDAVDERDAAPADRRLLVAVPVRAHGGDSAAARTDSMIFT
jgi:hypothetical protein